MLEHQWSHPPSHSTHRAILLVAALCAACTAWNGPRAAAPASSLPSCSAVPQLVAAQPSLLGFLAVDPDHVYWAGSEGVIMSAPKAGGQSKLLTKTELAPQSIATHAGKVYWVEYGALRAVSGSGGNVSTLATGNGSTRGLVEVGDDQVVNGLDRDAISLIQPGGVERVLYSGPIGYRLAADSAGVAFFAGSHAGQLALVLAPRQGEPRTLVAGPLEQGPLAMDAEYVWFDGGMGIQRILRNGSGLPMVVTYDHATDLILDGGTLFYVTDAGELRRVPSSGGVPATLASFGRHSFGNLAVDQHCVYFAANGVIMRIAREVKAPAGAKRVTGG